MKLEASPISAFLEASATAVGIGMVLGGFAVGLIGVLRRKSRDELELHALKAGYLLALLCLVVRWVDIVRTI